jgi:hypothetical protein
MEQEKIKLENVYNPSQQEIEVISKVYEKFYKWRTIQTTNWSQFEGYNLKTYISTAREKFNGLIPIDPTIERKKFFSKEFRNNAEKILTYIANLAQNPSFYGEEGLDGNIATLLNAFLNYYRRGAKWKILDALHFLQTIIDGTGIVYVSWNPRKRKLKNIKYVDLESGEIEFENKDVQENSVEEIWVDPLDIFVPKIWEIDIDKQGELIWRKIMTWDDFKRNYGVYPLAENVYPGERLSQDSIFSQFIDKTLFNTEKIEILNYYNTEEDEYVIIANGVFLNPISSKQRRSKISPLPWNHKELPFAKTIYRPTSPPLFFGASLMHLVKDEVEAYNELIEMALDRIYKAINPPIVTNDYSIPNNFKLESGKLYVSRGDFKEINMNQLDNNVWNVYGLLQNQIEKTSTPAISPSTPSRQPKSAMENLIRQQKELQSHQIQKLFLQDLLEQKVWLLIQNVLQFLTAEKMERMTGSVFQKVLFIDDIQTPAGMSSLEIRIKDKISSPEELKKESIIKSLVLKKKVEIIEVSIEALQNLKFDVGIKFDLENTPELKKALFMEFVKTLMAMFPQQIDPQKLLIRLFEVYNENPADYIPNQAVFQLYSGIKEQRPTIPQQPQEGNIQSDITQTQRGTMGVLGTGSGSEIGRVSLNDLLLTENA